MKIGRRLSNKKKLSEKLTKTFASLEYYSWPESHTMCMLCQERSNTGKIVHIIKLEKKNYCSMTTYICCSLAYEWTIKKLIFFFGKLASK